MLLCGDNPSAKTPPFNVNTTKPPLKGTDRERMAVREIHRLIDSLQAIGECLGLNLSLRDTVTWLIRGFFCVWVWRKYNSPIIQVNRHIIIPNHLRTLLLMEHPDRPSQLTPCQRTASISRSLIDTIIGAIYVRMTSCFISLWWTTSRALRPCWYLMSKWLHLLTV